MNRQKLLQNPLPINRVAARVVKPAESEDVWLPKPKPHEGFVESDEVLHTAPLPDAAPPELLALPGRRRGRMVIVGYAADQGGGKSAKWVVRCDCGRYEHRTRVIRWLGTDANDFCRECQRRAFLLQGGRTPSPAPAQRATRA